mgnify:CR=1 FL=1
MQEKLSALRFPVNEHNRLCKNFESALALIEEFRDKQKELDYEVDGLVIQLNSLAHRKKLGATHAICMTVQHGLKGVIFGFLGFQFLPWLPALLVMILSGFLGTLTGRRILHRLPEKLFTQLFRAILTVLGVRLLLLAFIG